MIAGAAPNSTPVTSDAPNGKADHQPATATDRPGRLVAPRNASSTIARAPANDTSRPARPRRRTPAGSIRSGAARPAAFATRRARRASPFRSAAPRLCASSRLARLAHAISSTAAASACSSRSDGATASRMLPTPDGAGMTLIRCRGISARSLGGQLDACRASAAASRSGAPGAAESPRPASAGRSRRASAAASRRAAAPPAGAAARSTAASRGPAGSAAASPRRILSGATPTMVAVTPFSVTVLPEDVGARLEPVASTRVWLRTATGAAPRAIVVAAESAARPRGTARTAGSSCRTRTRHSGFRPARRHRAADRDRSRVGLERGEMAELRRRVSQVRVKIVGKQRERALHARVHAARVGVADAIQLRWDAEPAAASAGRDRSA